jgi:hypothetical protein
MKTLFLCLLVLVAAQILALGSARGQAAAGSPPPGATPPAARPETSTVTFRGVVVDDESGQPIEKFTVQWGWPAGANDTNISWGGMSQTSDRWPSGAFSATTGWDNGKKIWVRILADGYTAEPVTPTPLTAPGQALNLTVRLRRGAAIQGLVLDHTGKPVAGAHAQLLGDRQINVLGNGPDGRPDSRAQPPQFVTDAQGRFRITGAAKNQSLIVTAPTLMAWRVTVADPAQDVTIRLPEPAVLQVRYDIAGAPAAGDLRIELKTWDMPDWKYATVMWYEPLANGADRPAENRRLTPGTYDVARIKQLRLANFGQSVFCDRQTVTLASGKTTELTFVRKTGAPVAGTVQGLGNLPGAFILVRSAEATGNPRALDESKLPTYDGQVCAADGTFKTELLSPGAYTLVAHAYGPDPYPNRTGIRLPDLVGTVKVTVPDRGTPAPVTIPLQPQSPRPTPTPSDLP